METAGLLAEGNCCSEVGDGLEPGKISPVYKRAVHRRYLDPGDNVDKHDVMKYQCVSEVCIHWKDAQHVPNGVVGC